MENHNSAAPKKRNTQFIAARVFTSLFAAFYILALGPKLIGGYFNLGEGGLSREGWEEWVMELTFYIFIIGFAFSWWRKCTGGIIILIASIVQTAPFLIIIGNFGSLIFGVPMLVSAILFLFVCRSEAQKTTQ